MNVGFWPKAVIVAGLKRRKCIGALRAEQLPAQYCSNFNTQLMPQSASVARAVSDIGV